MKSALVIGISGATCSGKTTLALELKKLFPKSKIFHQDDYFLDVDDPRHTWCKDVNHINYDILTSLDMKKLLGDIKSVLESRELCKKSTKQETRLIKSEVSRSDMCSLINQTIEENDIEVVFLDGFLLYSYKPLLPIVTLKYFHLLNKDECVERREKRVYEPPDIPGYFEKCVWPEYLKHVEEIKSNVKDITYFSSECNNVIDVILKDIYDCLQLKNTDGC